MSEHLTPGLLNSLADGELSADQLAAANEHLAQCPGCTSSALIQSLLKSATARAGQRYAVPPELQARLTRLARSAQQPGSPQETPRIRTARWPGGALGLSGWAAACALMLIIGSIILFENHARQTAIGVAESTALVTEACDEHIAALASNTPPQVISTDRHTVKPWFQGKLPFSFNLPENLPADTKLEGADLTYFHNQPAALLLYSIGKHRVSVFMLQKANTIWFNGPTAEHAGFHVAAFNTANLEVIAVGDVDPARLSELAGVIEGTQDGAGPEAK
jgi:anti-sigma factor RsiW